MLLPLRFNLLLAAKLIHCNDIRVVKAEAAAAARDGRGAARGQGKRPCPELTAAGDDTYQRDERVKLK